METRLDFTDNIASIDRTLDRIASESGPGVDADPVGDRRDHLRQRTGQLVRARGRDAVSRKRERLHEQDDAAGDERGTDYPKIPIRPDHQPRRNDDGRPAIRRGREQNRRQE